MADLYWFDGQPFDGIVPAAPQPTPPNYETYWVDGHAASAIFTLADVTPYNPPVVVYPQFSSYYGNETFWLDGHAAEGIKTTLLNHTGTLTFWIDGTPADYLFIKGNNEIGKMFNVFDE